MLQAKNITLRHPKTETPVISDATFSVKPGQRLVVMGKSGAGKTTLLSALYGKLALQSGQFTLSGDEVYPDGKLPLVPPIQTIALAEQNGTLNPHARVTSVLRQLAPSEEENPLREKIIEVLEAVRLTHRKEAFVRNLSGGERQRLALAGLFLGRAKVWLLDEAFNQLDTAMRFAMMEEVIKRQGQRMVIAALHLPEEAHYLSDEVGVLQNGTIVQRAPWQSLKNQPHNLEVAGLLGVFNTLEETDFQKIFTHATPPRRVEGKVLIWPEEVKGLKPVKPNSIVKRGAFTVFEYGGGVRVVGYS